ncbi:hypothetical protein PanWU01x14_117360, partial [Parasponia andersonii]
AHAAFQTLPERVAKTSIAEAVGRLLIWAITCFACTCIPCTCLCLQTEIAHMRRSFLYPIRSLKSATSEYATHDPNLHRFC